MVLIATIRNATNVEKQELVGPETSGYCCRTNRHKPGKADIMHIVPCRWLQTANYGSVYLAGNARNPMVTEAQADHFLYYKISQMVDPGRVKNIVVY